MLENEQLILKTDTYLTDFAYYIEKLKNPQAISDPAIDKIASRLEAMNKNPPSNQDKLAEVLSKIHNEKDDKFVKILDTIVSASNRSYLAVLFMKIIQLC